MGVRDRVTSLMVYGPFSYIFLHKSSQHNISLRLFPKACFTVYFLLVRFSTLALISYPVL